MAGVIKRLDAMGISTDFPDAPFEADIDPNSGMYQMLKYFFPDDPNLKWMRATMLHADGTEEPCQNDDNMKPLNKRPGTIEGYVEVLPLPLLLLLSLSLPLLLLLPLPLPHALCGCGCRCRRRRRHRTPSAARPLPHALCRAHRTTHSRLHLHPP